MGLMHMLLLSCRKATLLVEQRTLTSLDTTERMQLWMHIRICAGCAAFASQSALIERWIEERDDTSVHLTTGSFEERIIEKTSGPLGA